MLSLIRDFTRKRWSFRVSRSLVGTDSTGPVRQAGTPALRLNLKSQRMNIFLPDVLCGVKWETHRKQRSS
jgi:hypothetical protein